MPTPEDEQLVRFEGFPGGVNNRIRETENGARDGQPGGFVREAVNVDFSVEGKPRRRQGYTKLIAGDCHSLWRHPSLSYALMVKDGRLVKLTGEPGATPEVADLGPASATRAMSYDALNGVVYFSNGVDMGRISLAGERLPWGMDVPLIAVSPAAGPALPDGCYQISATYVDVDGVEHGACEPVMYRVMDQQLRVTVDGPFPVRADYVQVYVTQADGDVLYAAATLSAPGTVAIDAGKIGRGRPIETLFKTAPFPGQLVRHFSGRIYVAVENIVFFTDPLRYELVSPASALFMFPSRVTLLEPAHDGLYVGYESAVDFLSGTDPYDMQRRMVASQSAVEGTGRQVPGNHFDTPLDYVPVWWAQHSGFVLGLPGGQLRLLSEDRLAAPRFGAGAMITREQEGMTQLISALRQPGGGAARATDSVVAEIRRSNVQ